SYYKQIPNLIRPRQQTGDPFFVAFDSYYKQIPNLIRPRQQTGDPFFVAFDFAPQTFRWDYDKDQPAALTRIAVQRMLQKEVKRAGVKVTPTMLRNRFILNALQNGMKPQEIKVFLGLKSVEALHRYVQFWNELQRKNNRINI
ncbi:site-specific integrase, partial [Bacillus thuringiensis]